MSKFEFVKETKVEYGKDGYTERSFYYTRKDGRFIADSLNYNESIAKGCYDLLVAGKSFEPVITVLETYEDEKV